MNDRKKYTLYSDGAYTSVGSKMGLAFIVVEDDKKIYEWCQGKEGGTSQRAELMSAIYGLYSIKKPSDIHVISDSQYLICTMTKGWKRKVNHDLWEHLDKLSKYHNITWEWCRGHADNVFNNECDQLAYKSSLIIDK